MRKMRIALDEDSFLPTLFIKRENGQIIKYDFVATPETSLLSKYSDAQRQRINDVNRILLQKGEEILSEDEMDFLVDPLGFSQLPEVSEEELQLLAGFKVEKRIIPTDKHIEGEDE